jgi:hypothetical protein
MDVTNLIPFITALAPIVVLVMSSVKKIFPWIKDLIAWIATFLVSLVVCLIWNLSHHLPAIQFIILTFGTGIVASGGWNLLKEIIGWLPVGDKK